MAREDGLVLCLFLQVGNLFYREVSIRRGKDFENNRKFLPVDYGISLQVWTNSKL